MDGSMSEQTTKYSYPDGSKVTYEESELGDSKWTYENDDGFKAEQSFDVNGAGSYSDSEGNKIETDENGNVTSWSTEVDTDGDGEADTTVVVCDPCDKPSDPPPATSQCPDPEFCAACTRAANSLPAVIGSCAMSGGASSTCQTYGTTSNCCGTREPPETNSRMVTPNPMGDFSCYPIQTEAPEVFIACLERCEKANNQKCQRLCSYTRSRPDFVGIYERICLYFDSADCPSAGPALFAGGALKTSPSVVPALPIDKFLMLEPTEYDRWQ